MNQYQKLRIENCNNQENMARIGECADKAITYTSLQCPYAFSGIWVNEDGFLTGDFIVGQMDSKTESEMAHELQNIFNQKLASLIEEAF